MNVFRKSDLAKATELELAMSIALRTNNASPEVYRQFVQESEEFLAALGANTHDLAVCKVLVNRRSERLRMFLPVASTRH